MSLIDGSMALIEVFAVPITIVVAAFFSIKFINNILNDVKKNTIDKSPAEDKESIEEGFTFIDTAYKWTFVAVCVGTFVGFIANFIKYIFK